MIGNGNIEEPGISCDLSRERVLTDKRKSEEVERGHRKSEGSYIPKKQGNACGGKGPG